MYLHGPPSDPPPKPDRREEVFDAIQAVLSAWGLYSLLVQFLTRGKQ